ncbi:uncharacterized protein CLAFUR5_07283 [Fulvia fulva]|uniref:Uncharacterized protein n=1 Tax=Passalora fulva TaxID=5499 RepID=A0A9Q8UQS3_PASFU|nr:uncharacterized protein CLAFUR5_07283 [Fulvia fulva]UJO19059.1 hypothetical protein CLAFUR5_07283 [Fulvia fulva]WPV31591.1 hypothetical protein CLAFUW7_07150 [Fulvia fulva]
MTQPRFRGTSLPTFDAETEALLDLIKTAIDEESNFATWREKNVPDEQMETVMRVMCVANAACGREYHSVLRRAYTKELDFRQLMVAPKKIATSMELQDEGRKKTPRERQRDMFTRLVEEIREFREAVAAVKVVPGF